MSDASAFARSVLYRALSIANAAPGPASLLHTKVGLVSNLASDFWVASLLACHGSDVFVATPAAPDWSAETAKIRDQLIEAILRDYPELTTRPLAEMGPDRLSSVAGFHHEPLGHDTPAPDLGRRLQRLCVYDVRRGSRGPENDLMPLGQMLDTGGVLEVWEDDSAIFPDELRHDLERQAPELGWGIWRRPDPRTEAFRRVLSMIKLSGPLNEFPVEGAEHPTVMAHAMARIEFAAQFVSGADVLEAGCGTGIGARRFTQLGARSVSALDRSTEALAVAATHTSDALIHYRPWDLNRLPLPFEDQTFDVVVCMEVLEHITAQEEALREFYRVLRPGGTLVVSVPDAGFEQEWERLNRFGNPHHLSVPPRAVVERYLSDFEETRWYSQFDAVASLVTSGSAAEGSASFMSSPVPGGARSVHVAVASKAGGTGARRTPREPRPHLYIHDNFFERQLEWQRWSRSMLEEVQSLRWNLWTADNRQRAAQRHPPKRSRPKTLTARTPKSEGQA